MSEQLAYLAGFFDGEGHVAIVRRAAHKRNPSGKIYRYTRFLLAISVSQKTIDPLKLFHIKFGGSLAAVSGKRSYDQKTYHRYDWKCSTAQAAYALQKM